MHSYNPHFLNTKDTSPNFISIHHISEMSSATKPDLLFSLKIQTVIKTYHFVVEEIGFRYMGLFLNSQIHLLRQ